MKLLETYKRKFETFKIRSKQNCSSYWSFYDSNYLWDSKNILLNEAEEPQYSHQCWHLADFQIASQVCHDIMHNDLHISLTIYWDSLDVLRQATEADMLKTYSTAATCSTNLWTRSHLQYKFVNIQRGNAYTLQSIGVHERHQLACTAVNCYAFILTLILFDGIGKFSFLMIKLSWIIEKLLFVNNKLNSCCHDMICISYFRMIFDILEMKFSQDLPPLEVKLMIARLFY